MADGKDKDESRAIGGKARAESLTPEERKEIARKAAQARWSEDVPKAFYSGDLKIGDIVIPCAVLEDETRVLTQRGFSVALGRYKNPRKNTVVELPVFLSAANLKSFIDNDLLRSSTQIKFRMSEGGGGLHGNIALGYRADLLPKVCKVYLDAKQEGKLLKSQEHIAKKCLILLEGLATVGIIALVDEATGFQADRAKDALAKILEKFIAKELCKWAKTFPDEFYSRLFFLKDYDASKFSKKKPQWVGHVTNDVVYQRLAPGVLDELKKLTPKTPSGNRKNRFHQRLTPDLGHPKLREHLAAVVALMNASENWDEFYALLNKSLPKWDKRSPLFDGDY